jgi:hypothetical protein
MRVPWAMRIKGIPAFITVLMISRYTIAIAEECPCDIYAGAGTPCVAAHSTVRALIGSYKGPLYQIRRVSDNAIKDIPQLSDGVADASVQESFLGAAARAGVISIIYDQTGNGNDLKKAEVCQSGCSGCPGDASKKGQPDVEAFADGAKITINGHTAYGVHILPCGNGIPNQTGYRVKVGNKVPKGDEPESMYFVVDGKNTNSSCCFDYGNASTNLMASGNMDAVEFSKNQYWGYGAGSGPWVAADLEAGVYTWGGSGKNNNSISLAYPFVTAMNKNNSNGKTPGPFTLKGGDAQSGKLTTMWQGARPNGYATLNKQGGIVLGIGGDNAAGAAGNFFEGCICAGVPPDSIDDKIQANIVAAGYGRTTTAVSRSVHSGNRVRAFTVQYNQSTSVATISYVVRDRRRVGVSIFNQQGRRIAVLAPGMKSAGRHDEAWNARGASAGVYFWRMTIDGSDEGSGKVVIGR